MSIPPSSTAGGTPCFVDATVQQYVDEAVLRRAGENEVRCSQTERKAVPFHLFRVVMRRSVS